MSNYLATLVAMACLPVANAQIQQATPQNPTSATNQPAPIVRSSPQAYRTPQIFDVQPASGVSVRSDVENGFQTVSASDSQTELRVLHGRADVTLHHPKDHSEIVVDLPHGRVSLLKDGLYTFNAETSTVRVLRGEAEAFSGASIEGKGTKVKEEQQLTVSDTGKLRAVEAYPYELTADLIGEEDPDGDRPPHSGYATYSDDYYFGGYPYLAVGYGYPFGGFYPYGYGYPFGFGFGYYGGFRGRGFRR